MSHVVVNLLQVKETDPTPNAGSLEHIAALNCERIPEIWIGEIAIHSFPLLTRGVHTCFILDEKPAVPISAGIGAIQYLYIFDSYLYIFHHIRTSTANFKITVNQSFPYQIL